MSRARANHHHVYVIELDEAVLKDRKFLSANPHYKDCLGAIPLYVGMTGLDPEQRFENHRNGYKSCKYVKKYGLRLIPEMYESYNPMSYEDAVRMEQNLAEKLRCEGYVVWQK
ncbi:MAG: hypothetical protein ACE5F3_01745 [Mariprofundaceae bacterium]